MVVEELLGLVVEDLLGLEVVIYLSLVHIQPIWTVSELFELLLHGDILLCECFHTVEKLAI